MKTKRIYSQGIGMELGIRICLTHNEKWDEKISGRNRITKSRMNWDAWIEEQLKI